MGEALPYGIVPPLGKFCPWDLFRGKVCHMVFLQGESLLYGTISGGGGNNSHVTPGCHRIRLIRHSRLPAGNALWFCQNFLFLFLFIYFYFFFFRRQGFRMITFDRQAGPLQNFNRSHVMVIGRSVLFSDPARPPGGGVGRPKHPKIPPPKKNLGGGAF